MNKKNLSRRDFLKSSALGSAAVLIPSAMSEFSCDYAEKSKGKIEKDISKWEIDTPALLIDLDAFERNLKKMSEYCRKNGLLLRPHTKTHKCPVISELQIASGAIGICTAKVSEADVMAEGGIRDILVTSPVVTTYKINRLMNIRKKTSGLMVVVDNFRNVKDLSEAALSNNLKLDVLVDINPPGMNRTGIAPGKPAVDLSRAVLKSEGLRFRGIQCYEGNMQHIHGFKDRRQKNLASMETAAETKRMMEKEGIDVEIFSGGGTGSYNIDHELSGFTDVQAGSYIFMDVQYLAIGGKEFPDDHYGDFEPSLTVISTAISQPVKGAITIDAGIKSLSTAGPKPVPKDITGISYGFMGDEHGQLTFDEPSCDITIGDKVELIVSHCDPTVNLYDNYYCIRNDRLETIWEISGRGKSQ